LGGTPILVTHSEEQMLALAPAGAPETWRRESVEPQNIPASVAAAVSDVSHGPDSLSFRYVAPSKGFLLVTDRWATGWEVTVNDQKRPVFGGNFIFRAVQVEGGPNLVQFRYEPRGFWPLVMVSWGTLVVIVVWQIRRLILRRAAGRAG